MSERLREIMAQLSDQSRYVRVPGVPVFDEHEEEYWVDKDGKPCAKGAPGAQRKVRRFDRRALEEIARRCNARDRTGSLAPLTFGHTVTGAPEEEQPEPRGYAVGYSVDHDESLGRDVIRTNFYIDRDNYPKATTFPRVSIELWPKHGIIDPIALLRRTPRRDLGQWHYDRAGRPVLRYQMESQMANPLRYEADDDLFDEDPAGGEKAGGEGGEAGMSDEQAHEKYMRDCYSHPHHEAAHRHLKAKYGMAHGLPGEEGALGAAPPHDPTAPPTADMPPMKNSMVMPSATNSGAAETPRKNSRDGGVGRDADRVRIAKLEAQVQRYQRHVEEAEREKAEAQAARIVTQLIAEDYVLDEEKEVERFSRLDEAGRKDRADWIREYGRKAPVGGHGPLVRPERVAAGDLAEDPERLMNDKSALEAVRKYRRESGDHDTPIHEVAAKILPMKYGRKEGA